MKSIFKAVAVVTIFSVITRALGFFFRIYLSRKLGAEGLGLFQMATSILGIFMTLISSGIPLTTAKLVSKYETQNELKKRHQVVSSALVVALCVAVACSVIIFLLKNLWSIVLTDNRAVEVVLILIPSILFSAVYVVFRGALWGHKDYFNCGLTELIEQIVRFALTFIMLLNITDFFVATKYSAMAFNLTCLISAIISMIIYIKRYHLTFMRGKYKEIINCAAPVTGVKLANSLVQPITTIIIPSMLLVAGYSSSEAISSLGVVMGMTFPMLFVPMSVIGSLSMVLIPSISSLITQKKYSEIENNISNSFKIAIFISMLFIPLYFAVGDLIGLVLFNNTLSGVILQFSAICVLPITLCNLTGSILDALNLEVKAFINYIIGSLTLILSLIILTPTIGINAVTLSFFISMSLISLLNLKTIKKSLPNLELNFISLTFKYTLIALPSSLFGHFIANICLNFLPNFFSAVAGGGIAILSSLILAKIFNLFDIKDLLYLLKHNKKRTN